MKKMIYGVLLTMVCLVAQVFTISAQSDCDIVFDFTTTPLNLVYENTTNAGATATGTATIETTGSNKVLQVVTGASNGYVKLTITLPDGKTLADYSSTLSLKVYLTTTGDTNYKQLKYGLNGTASSNFLGSNLSRETWHTGIISLSGLSSTATSFYVILGCSWNSGATFYIDDITLPFTGDCTPAVTKLKPTISTVPTLGNIDCGETLTDVTLTGGEATYTPEGESPITVAGSFAFEKPSTKLQFADNGKSYKLVFTPTDGETYDTCSVKLPVTVIDNGSCFTPCSATVGYLMLDCFNDKELDATYTVIKGENSGSLSVATVVIDPLDANNQVIKFENKDYGQYLQLTVTLPCNNRTLGDYEAISFKVYSADANGIGTYQPIRVSVNQEQLGNGVAATTVTNNGSDGYKSWTTVERTLPTIFSSHSSDKTFTLQLGFRTSAKTYYFDDIMLKEKSNLPDCNDGGTTTWVGSTDDWNTYTNWNPKYVPTSSNNVIIPQVSTYPALTSNVTVRQLVLEPGAALDLGNSSLSATTSIKAQTLMDSQLWYSIGFPFDVATVYSENHKDVLDAGVNFWLNSYTGTAFSPATTISETTGYIIELPSGFGLGKTISYISGTVTNLAKGNLYFDADGAYTLTANPTLAPLPTTTLGTNKHIYRLKYDLEENPPVGYALSDGEAIAPFEAVITVVNANPLSRISLNTDVVTGKPNIEIDANIVAEHYYNLQGVEIAVGARFIAPTQGNIIIKKTVYESGAVSVSKIINK